jgi:hypothetical protein
LLADCDCLFTVFVNTLRFIRLHSFFFHFRKFLLCHLPL